MRDLLLGETRKMWTIVLLLVSNIFLAFVSEEKYILIYVRSNLFYYFWMFSSIFQFSAAVIACWKHLSSLFFGIFRFIVFDYLHFCTFDVFFIKGKCNLFWIAVVGCIVIYFCFEKLHNFFDIACEIFHRPRNVTN